MALTGIRLALRVQRFVLLSLRIKIYRMTQIVLGLYAYFIWYGLYRLI